MRFYIKPHIAYYELEVLPQSIMSASQDPAGEADIGGDDNADYADASEFHRNIWED